MIKYFIVFLFLLVSFSAYTQNVQKDSVEVLPYVAPDIDSISHHIRSVEIDSLSLEEFKDAAKAMYDELIKSLEERPSFPITSWDSLIVRRENTLLDEPIDLRRSYGFSGDQEELMNKPSVLIEKKPKGKVTTGSAKPKI